ncbi:hypothetical protein FRC03_009150 [Tulasnella sp. 419]|nr:hypothetical protein FRC03_009150 [Tulasnella sp. 419]
MMTTKATTVDGFETCYQVNMLGPFALTMSFLRNGFFSPTARIVQVSSAIIYRNINPLDPKDLNFKSMAEGTGGFLAGTLLGLYSSSKAQQVIFTRELQRRLSKFDQFKDVVVQSCHPGLVQSSIWDRSAILEKSKTLKLFMAILNHIYGIQCHVAALTPLFLTVSQKAAEPCMKGGFWERAHQKWVPYWMLDEALCDTLWRKWIEDAEIHDPLHDSVEDYHIDSGSRVSNGL